MHTRFFIRAGRSAAGFALALSALSSFLARPAQASPRPLPFSYPYETLAEKAFEVEEVVDTTPVRAYDSTGAQTWLPLSTLVTELEYGITNRLELGMYFQFIDEPSTGGTAPLRFDGLKQRLRYRFAESGQWPIDVAVYGELAELKQEFEIEGKIILQRRFGPARVVTNLWAEREMYYQGQREWVLHPTLGAVYEITPAVQVGVEGWMVKEIADHQPNPPPIDNFNAGPIVYVGPTINIQTAKFWVTIGAYDRVNKTGRPARIGDIYGRYWVRAMLGIDL